MITVELIKHDALDYIVEVLPGGRVKVYWPGFGMTRSELNHYVRDKVDSHFESLVPKQDYYWRGTNNKDEIKLIRSGQLRPSRNHADGSTEVGLSVAEHLGYVMTAGYKYGYRVRGIVTGQGSDGEVILAMDSLQPLDKAPRSIANIETKEGRQYLDALRKAVVDTGWTVEQYKKAMFLTIPS